MKHIYDKTRLEEGEARKYMRQIVSAVDHLHRAGIIHRWGCVCVPVSVCVGGYCATLLIALALRVHSFPYVVPCVHEASTVVLLPPVVQLSLIKVMHSGG